MNTANTLRPPSASLKAWVLAARPKTLTASLVPILAATALAYAHGLLSSPQLSLWAFLSAFFIQIGTNLVNDAKDFERGTDNAERIGPMRVTASGLLSGRQVMWGAALFFMAAFLCGLPLVIKSGVPLLIIGLVSILCGYLYTSGPYPLAYVGLGDIFVVIFFGLVAVGGVYYLQAARWDAGVLVIGLQVGFLSTVLIAINNLRDWVGDAKNNKRTLAVRFGEKFSKAEISFLLFSPYLLGMYFREDYPWAFYLPFIILPLSFKLDRKIHATRPGPVYNQYLAQAAAIHLLFGILLSVGLIYGR